MLLKPECIDKISLIMRNKNQIVLFHIVSWVIAYVFLGVILFLIDEARAGLFGKGIETDLLFSLRVSS